MEKLSAYLNRKISKTHSFVIVLSVILTCFAVGVWGYISTLKNLRQSSSQSLSLLTSLIYDRNWTLVNEYLDVWGEKSSLTFIQIVSKHDKSVLYQSNLNKGILGISVCNEDLTSQIIELKACAQIISNELLVSVISITLCLVIFFAMTYILFKKHLSEDIDELTNQVYGLIEQSDGDDLETVSSIEEIHRLNLILQNKKEQIRKTSEATAFIDISRRIAHDIRSPVAVINNLVRKENISSLDKDILEASAKSLSSMAEKLLVETKNDLNQLKSVRYNLKSKLQKIIASKKIEFGDKEINLNFIVSLKDEIVLWVPEIEFDRVLSNLINNSVEACRSSISEIRFCGCNNSEGFEFIIMDNGRGFSCDLIEKFNNDVELHSTKKSGHGIGINAARDFIRSLEGEIFISNTIDGGAQVIIRLPSYRFINPSVPIILIDDDKYVRYSWNSAALEKGITLKSFSSINEFEESLPSLSNESEVFIDSDLNNSQKGEDYILRLQALGFRKINIQTGRSPEEFNCLNIVNSIVAKTFPY